MNCLEISQEEEVKTLENDNEIYEILGDLGLDEDEILSINRRNKMLNEITGEEATRIIDFFSIKCNLNNEDIARLVIKNPFILNESFERIDLLTEMYEKIGFSEDEYKSYITNFDKAFSLNPKEVLENISDMMRSGKDMAEIKKMLIEKPNKIFF